MARQTKEIEKTAEEEGAFPIEDPVLLDHMILTRDVKHPVTGVNLLTKGHLLTARSLEQLRNISVQMVFAAPYAEESMTEAVEQVHGYFQSVEKIIETKGMSLSNAATLFQEMESAKELRKIVDNQMRTVFQYFNDHAADTLVKLNNHHPDSAHHSIISGFNAMALTKALNWPEEEVLEAAMATMTHDTGKVKVPLDTLAWPGALNDKQWKETQLHTLFGGALLHQGSLSNASMVALNHHEWYASVKGKGYGGLTRFRENAKVDLGMDVDHFISQASPRQLEMMQVCAIADMVAALEEIRSYKGALPAIKVLIIMNDDAKRGHFNPEHYRAWHTLYTRRNKRLLPNQLRFALPREKEVIVQRGGKKFIKLDAKIRRLTYSELEQMNLLPKLKAQMFDLDVIKKENGIAMDRMERRGNIKADPQKMERLGINPEKRLVLLLPAQEVRLGLSEMRELGVDERKLQQKKLVMLLQQSPRGVTLPDLGKVGIHVPKEQLAPREESLQKKIFYDLLVTEELGPSHAQFAIVREGDQLKDLSKANIYKTLGPLRNYLFNQVGLVELDFSALTTTLPNLSGIVRGDHWKPRTAPKKG